MDVDRRERVVEQINVAVAVHGPGQTDPLFLPAAHWVVGWDAARIVREIGQIWVG